MPNSRPAVGQGAASGKSPGEEPFVSEFLSESSDEFRRRTGQPADPPIVRDRPPVRPTAPVAAHTPPPLVPRRTPSQRLPEGWGRLLIAGGIGAGLALLLLGFPSATPEEPVAPAAPAAAVDGTVRIVTRPSGAEVFINGAKQGESPLSVTLPAGAYRLELRRDEAVRQLPLVVESGQVVSEFVDIPGPTVLGVATDEDGLGVAVDGVYRGMTPLRLTGLEPGEHRVVIGTGPAAVVRTVRLEPGGSVDLFVTTRTQVTDAGWLTIRAPIALRLYEGGQLIGTSESPRVMVAAGRRSLVLSNEELGFRTTLSVEVPAGITVPVTIPVPDAIVARAAGTPSPTAP